MGLLPNPTPSLTSTPVSEVAGGNQEGMREDVSGNHEGTVGGEPAE